MSLTFTKMHGLGNDYIFVSLFDQQVADPARLAKTLSDRHRGIGGDGLILLAPPDVPDAHVRMHMYNADGSRGEMCGNGIRCLAKLAWERGLARHNPLRVATDRGVLELALTVESDIVMRVRVDMGAPILNPPDIPVALGGKRVVGISIPLEDRCMLVTCVSMGNPHAVFFVPDLKRVPLREWGAKLERHPIFPKRANVHFAQVRRPERIAIMTWERGSGVTQACGTGAAAVCVAGVLNGLTRRSVTAELAGGELELEWDEPTDHVFMTGPATEVFRGVWSG